MKKKFLFSAALCFLILGCSKPKAVTPPQDQGPLSALRTAISEGNYEQGFRMAQEITGKIPPDSALPEGLYLEGYIQAFGRSNFQEARAPLKQLLALYPKGPFSPSALRLLADCEYWLGHYRKAEEAYKKLSTDSEGKALEIYGLLQTGNCLLLDDKVGDALTAYRELVEKYPSDSAADSAQLMIANVYLKLQNRSQAKSELQKLMAFSKNTDVQEAAQKTLRQLEEEEPFRKGIGVPE